MHIRIDRGSNLKDEIALFQHYFFGNDFKKHEFIDETRVFTNVWLSSSIVMWFYIACSYLIYENSTIGSIGLLLSIVIASAPLIIKYTKDFFLAGLIISISVHTFQVCFCLLNGGIDAASAILFIAHSVIMTFLNCKKTIVLSLILTTLTVISISMTINFKLLAINGQSYTPTDAMTICSILFFTLLFTVYKIVQLNISDHRAKAVENRNAFFEDLIRITAHDINNSLSKTKLICSILKKELNRTNNISVDYIKQKIEMINNSNNQIKEINKSALQWMKAQDSDKKIQLKPLKFKEVIDHIVDSFDIIVKNKNITFQFDCAETIKSSIMVNPEAFRNQVVSNIISNAIKYTYSGSCITIKSSFQNESLSLSVIDQGDGIDDRIIKNIYDPTKSTSRNGTAGETGTGFGMPIVKSFIEKMGGSLTINSIHKSTIPKNSHIKSGTTATLTVPLSPFC
jgi:signal transduction histidine kinase